MWRLACGAFLLAYPFLLKSSYKTLNYIHANDQSKISIPYKDGECYLKLLNETNHEHYLAHPLWSHRGYDSDCDAIQYARQQALYNQQEARLLMATSGLESVAAGAYLAYSFFSPGIGVGSLVQLLVLGWLGAMEMQYSLHFQHDMTHLVGNLVHHAGIIALGSVFQ